MSRGYLTRYGTRDILYGCMCKMSTVSLMFQNVVIVKKDLNLVRAKKIFKKINILRQHCFHLEDQREKKREDQFENKAF